MTIFNHPAFPADFARFSALGGIQADVVDQHQNARSVQNMRFIKPNKTEAQKRRKK